jgi:hypothetical protein
MDKYLFTDGTGGVKEVHSKEELENLARAAPKPEWIRIWVFNSQEWIAYSDFKKTSTPKTKKENPATGSLRPSIRTGNQWLKKFMLFSVAGSALLLVYNFSRIKWRKASPVQIFAARPANVPYINNDSLVQEIEFIRGQKLDRTTKTNLGIRNGWPDRILLQLKSERDTSSAGSKFYNTEITIDNTTGYQLDKAIVKFSVWNNGERTRTDTLEFSNISYAAPSKKIFQETFRGDSLSLSFETIKAKSFNFCYSADKTSNYGNTADRWYCRE